MYWTEHHLLCCTASHCTQKGANDVVMKLRREVLRRDLGNRVFVNTCGSIDLCDIGPNLVVYPEGIVYAGVRASDVPELVDAIANGETVERLVLGPETAAEQQRRDFYAALLTHDNDATRQQAETAAAELGLPDGWINEQGRRGFLATKPSPVDGIERISATTKALDRYRLRG